MIVKCVSAVAAEEGELGGTQKRLRPEKKKKRLGEEYKYSNEKETRETMPVQRKRGNVPQIGEERGSLDEASHSLPRLLPHSTYALCSFPPAQTE